MTHHPLTKAEREELRAIVDGKFEGNLDAVAVAFCVPRLLADLDAAEAERDALRQIAEGCCNATDGGCSPGVSIEFLRDVPSEVEHIKRERDRLRKMPQSAFEAATFRELNAMEAQRDRAESELDAERRMRVEAEAASDRAESERATAESIAAQATARMEEMRGERDALKAQLAALVLSVDIAVNEVSHSMSGRMCALHNYAMGSCTCGVQKIRAAIAAARGGES